MDFKIFFDELRDICAKYRLLLVTNVILAVIVFGLAIHAVWAADRSRVIIVPSHLASAVEIQGERASPEYVRIMLLHLTNLLYTYTPYSIMENYREFLAYIPPEKLNEVQEQLQGRIDRVSRLKINETFMATSVVFPERGIGVLSGKTIRWSAGQELATEDIHMKYKYNIKNGGFQIDEISLLTSSEFNALQRTAGK